MRFADPIFLAVAAAAAAVLVALFFALARARRAALARIGAMRLLPRLTASLSRRRRLFKQVAIASGAALLCVALARPQVGYRWEEAHRRGVDVMFAIDTSKSMLTHDVKPNRLERAKLAVRSLVEKFPGDRVGLVVFAGDAFVETPLTLDHRIFDESVAALDTNVIPLGGTNLASAIDRADKALASDAHDKVLVLLTDGEDLAGDALDAAKRAAKDGVVVYTLGVGTPSGQLVPVPGANGHTQFVRDDKGELVTSRLDEALLTKIAKATGGDYRPLGDSGQGLEALYRDELAKLPQSDLASRSLRVPLERFQWPLAIALVLLGLEPLVSERRRRRSTSRAPVLAAATIATLLLAPTAAWASPQSAQRAYDKGDFTTAEKQYADAAHASPADPRLDFNIGAAAYRKGAFEDAAKSFESTLRSEDLGLQQKAYYNLGNASFRIGEATLAKNDVEATKTRWKQAIGEYEGALRLRADDADARYNLELVKRRLAELEKKQRDEKQKQDQQQKKQGGQGSQKQNQGGQGSQKNQGSQGDQKQDRQGGQGQPKPEQRGDQGSPPPQARSSSDASDQVKPGELSKADAEALLDSLRGELKLGARGDREKAAQRQREPRRDW